MDDHDFLPDWCGLNFNDPTETRSTSPQLKAPEQICQASVYLNYETGGESVHREILTAVATQAAIELAMWTTWINTIAVQDGVTFQLLFADCNAFGAQLISPIAGSEPGSYSIVISLGCIPFLVGAANRLVTMRPINDSFTSPFVFHVEDGKWDPSTDPIGILTNEQGNNVYAKTQRTAVDSLILMLLHEAAHGCRGHPWVPKSVQKLIPNCRALESEADWGIGYLYVIGKASGMPTTRAALDQYALDRFVTANLCSYLGFQANNRNGVPSKYYLPYTRMVCAFDGVHQALLELAHPDAEIVNMLNSSMERYAMLEMEFPQIYTGWVSHYDPRAISDLALHRHRSHTISADLLRTAGARQAAPLNVKIQRF